MFDFDLTENYIVGRFFYMVNDFLPYLTLVICYYKFRFQFLDSSLHYKFLIHFLPDGVSV